MLTELSLSARLLHLGHVETCLVEVTLFLLESPGFFTASSSKLPSSAVMAREGSPFISKNVRNPIMLLSAGGD